MTPAARSLFVFGIYVFVVGVALVAAPSAMLDVLRLPHIADGWVRTFGLLSLVIGTYDVVGSRAGVLPYIRASVFVRLGFAAGVATLVLIQEMPPALLPLGLIDAAGAVWTAIALRERAPAVSVT